MAAPYAPYGQNEQVRILKLHTDYFHLLDIDY